MRRKQLLDHYHYKTFSDFPSHLLGTYSSKSYNEKVAHFSQKSSPLFIRIVG